MDFDTEGFIREIQQRQCLWDLKSEEYSNKNVKARKWAEIVEIFGKGNMTVEEKQEYGKHLQRKWKNIRDQFIKELNLIKNLQSGSAAKRKKTYIYFDQLLFLKDTTVVNATEGIVQVDVDASISNTDQGPYTSNSRPPKRNKKGAEDVIGKELINVLNRNIEIQTNKDDDQLFFLSLVKEFKKVSEHSQMDVKLNILNVIRNAQGRPPEFPPTQWDTSTWQRYPYYRGYSTGHHETGFPPAAQEIQKVSNSPLTSPLSTVSSQAPSVESQDSVLTLDADTFNNFDD